MATAPRRRPRDMNDPPTREGRTGGSYFIGPKSGLNFVASGSTTLDCALGGGWVLGRVANIIGDKSTGKTLLAIEASANFHRTYPRGSIFYRERESAFDEKYAAAMGMPVKKVDFGPSGTNRFDTVEGFEVDLKACIAKCTEKKQPGIYILDSLDSLSDAAELERAVGEGSYGTAKAKAMSEMFRKLVRPMEDAQLLLMVISQIRDKIGVMFGKKITRAGGHALDFYASHVIELAHMGQIKKTRQSVERVVGIDVLARCTKNKVSLPARAARFDIKFGYGIDDLTSCLDWLIEVKRIGELGLTIPRPAAGQKAKTITQAAADWLIETNDASDDEFRERCKMVTTTTQQVWNEIEAGFLPTRRKYHQHA